MRFETPPFAAPPIDSYGPGGFRVGGVWHDGPLFLRGESVSSWTPPESGPFTVEMFAPVLEGDREAEILLLGLGDEMRHIPWTLNKALLDRGIGLEAAPTPAACRTYNVLLGQGRDIAAALVPVTAEQ